MSWWMWMLLWLVLALGGIALLAWLCWRAFATGLRLFDTASAAVDQFSAVGATPAGGWPDDDRPAPITPAAPRRAGAAARDVPPS